MKTFFCFYNFSDFGNADKGLWTPVEKVYSSLTFYGTEKKLICVFLLQ